MHEKVLTNEQIELLAMIRLFKKSFYLVGGTAIALHLGHRRSIDFDLFTGRAFNRKIIHQKILANGCHIDKTLFASNEEFTLLINGVKVTFFKYPFDIPHEVIFNKFISLPSLIDLAAMKAYALGRRAKWKDYVDLFFIIKHHYLLNQITTRASDLFGDLFSEKLFRARLSFFEDIDYTEEVNYIGDGIKDEEIKIFLNNLATQPF